MKPMKHDPKLILQLQALREQIDDIHSKKDALAKAIANAFVTHFQ